MCQDADKISDEQLSLSLSCAPSDHDMEEPKLRSILWKG